MGIMFPQYPGCGARWEHSPFFIPAVGRSSRIALHTIFATARVSPVLTRARFETIALNREREMDRRRFLASAASLGIIGVWATRSAAVSSRVVWREYRASFPQGVASGDPDDHSVVLWTRRPFDQGERHALTVEVARDADFRSVVARARAPVLAAADWTC